MKITTIKYDEPKNKESALNLAAYISKQLDNYKTKGENLVKSKNDTAKKLKRLQETLANLESQISKVNTTETNWQNELKRLQTQFSLTEAEILETKSALLRKQLSALQKDAGVQQTGEESFF